MIADFFTKPLQGAVFLRFRDVIMGYKHVDSLEVFRERRNSPQERVGNGISEVDSSESGGGEDRASLARNRSNDLRTQGKTYAEVVSGR